MTTTAPALHDREHFEAWRDKQEVKIKLSVEINGSEIFSSDYLSIDGMEEDLRKPEGAIDEALDQMYEEAYGEEE